ncbi:MAG: 2-C-methyl-D-erythritol 4-phosphate cytidylyltransferase, partial [Caulobacteraceae bacterium]
MPFRAVIVAAGSGERAGEGLPKQWRKVGGQPLVRWSVEAMASAGAAEIIVVTPPGESARAAEALAGLAGWRVVDGGASRRESVVAGLRALTAAPDEIVLIHDAARPFLSVSYIKALIAAVGPGRGALPALPLADTLKAAGVDGVRTQSREGLWRAQTPQAFRLSDILSAHAAWNPSETLTDDAQALEHAGGEIVLVPGDPMLMKLTYPEDFAMAERLAGAARATRVGMGFDAHRFGSGENVTLCGVVIEHEHALIGHSDADAGLHALTDALLGAIGAGDIGDHFPPSDAQWK